MHNIASMRGFETPVPYHLVHNFLGDELIQRLFNHIETNQQAFLPTKVGNTGKGKVNTSIRTSSVLRDFGPLKEELESRFRAVLEDAIRELRMPSIDLARLELELVAHGDGAFYRRHIDTMTDLPDAISDRALTGVYYFHDNPKAFSGGELRLFSILPAENGGTFTDVEPNCDMLLLFPSWAPHEVRPVSCPSGNFLKGRFAINCWYRNRRSLSVQVPSSLAFNPSAAAKVCQLDGATYIDINAYNGKQSFIRQTLAMGRDSCYDTAIRLFDHKETDNLAIANLTSAETSALWRAGLLIDADEQPASFVTATPSWQADVYADNGFTLIEDCITPAAVSALLSYYRSKFEKTTLMQTGGSADRLEFHNDPAGRVMQHLLRKTVERIVGKPIKSSYTYTLLYREGAELAVHKDRPQCQYTVSLLIDYQPASPDRRSPWPLHLYTEPSESPQECFLTLGGGILFRGREIPHARPRLPASESCWVLLLHYVDADFEGSLD